MTTSTVMKRIIMILGGKGGTGKTLHCRQLYYFLIQAGVNCSAFDADVENPEFQEYHTESSQPVTAIDFVQTEQAKNFFTQIEQQKPDVVLVDMPGASGRATRDQIKRFGMFKIAQQLGYRVTLDTVINNAYNTINSLQMMQGFCGAQADYVVVKSDLWNQGSLNFDRWEKSETRKQFQTLKGIEISMPVLELSTFDVLHELGLSFFDQDQLPFGDRILLESFLDLSRPQIEAAADYLGLASQSPKPVKKAEVGNAGK